MDAVGGGSEWTREAWLIVAVVLIACCCCMTCKRQLHAGRDEIGVAHGGRVVAEGRFTAESRETYSSATVRTAASDLSTNVPRLWAFIAEKVIPDHGCRSVSFDADGTRKSFFTIEDRYLLAHLKIALVTPTYVTQDVGEDSRYCFYYWSPHAIGVHSGQQVSMTKVVIKMRGMQLITAYPCPAVKRGETQL